MAELQWDKTDWMVCLGVLPEIEEYETAFLYRVEQASFLLNVEITVDPDIHIQCGR